jgi:hypothetical protein
MMMNNRLQSALAMAALATVSIAIATTVSARPKVAEDPASDSATGDRDSSFVDVNTENRWSNSSSSYRSYIAPDGSYVGRTKVRVNYPGGASNTDVQVAVPPEALARIRSYWRQRWLRNNPAPQSTEPSR